MLKLAYNRTHFMHQQSNAQNSPSQASTVHEPRTSRCSSWVFEKAAEPEIKPPTSTGSWKKQKNYRKTFTSASLTMPKPLTVWITKNSGKFSKRWEYQTTFTCLLRNLYAGQEATVRTGHETMDWFQIGKGVHQGVYCHPAYLTYMQSTSYDMPDWMKYKLKSRLPGEISITSDMQMTPPLWQKVKRN